MKILTAVINNIENDQRLDKVCNSLLKFGFDVELIGTTLGGRPTLDKPFVTNFIHLKNQHSFKMYAEFNWKLFFMLWKKTNHETLLVANDLDSLLPFYFVSRLKKRPLVFDSHEIFSELPSLSTRPQTKRVWKSLEKWLLPKMTHCYTVSEGYANWFNENYGISPIVVRNTPKRQRFNEQENHIFFPLPLNPKGKKVILYQGAISMSRGLDHLIKAMTNVADAQLWIAGNGPKKEEYEKLTQTFNLTEKVFFLGNISPKVLQTITPLADVGISLEEDLGISYRYALPNKLFDYFQAKVPVLATYLPEIKRTVEEHKVGKVIDNHDPVHIAEKLNELLSEGKMAYRDALGKAALHFCWENEEAQLKKVYADFIAQK